MTIAAEICWRSKAASFETGEDGSAFVEALGVALFVGCVLRGVLMSFSKTDVGISFFEVTPLTLLALSRPGRGVMAARSVSNADMSFGSARRSLAVEAWLLPGLVLLAAPLSPSFCRLDKSSSSEQCRSSVWNGSKAFRFLDCTSPVACTERAVGGGCRKVKKLAVLFTWPPKSDWIPARKAAGGVSMRGLATAGGSRALTLLAAAMLSWRLRASDGSKSGSSIIFGARFSES